MSDLAYNTSVLTLERDYVSLTLSVGQIKNAHLDTGLTNVVLALCAFICLSSSSFLKMPSFTEAPGATHTY